jgi:hypothetical protein
MNSTLFPSERSDMGVLRSQLQIDLDNVTDYYRKTHQGHRLRKNGYGIPAEARFSRILTLNKEVLP